MNAKAIFDPNACPDHGCPDPRVCLSLKKHIHHELWVRWQENGIHRKMWELEAAGKTVNYAPPGPCINKLKVISACREGQKQWDICGCKEHETCMAEPGRPAAVGKICNIYDPEKRCPDYVSGKHPIVPSTSAKTFVAKFDKTNLHPSFPGERFNASMMAWKDGYLLLWRSGWAGSDLFISLLTDKFEPFGLPPIKLNIKHGAAQIGREDPRFFMFRGEVWVCFTGVRQDMRGQIITNMLYARLDQNFQVTEVYHPDIKGRNAWEKNHVPFEYDGAIYAVYSTTPHRVLKIDRDKAEWAYETTSNLPWKIDAEIRGGTPPQLVESAQCRECGIRRQKGESVCLVCSSQSWITELEYWHFFHSKIDTVQGLQYNLGLLTFENKPPFKIKRMIAEPIAWADWETKPADQYCACIWGAGAVKRDDTWFISCGIHDRWCEIHRFSHAELESKLVDVT